jgi:hypothetical protein
MHQLDHILGLLHREWWLISLDLRLGQFPPSRVLRRRELRQLQPL